MAYPNFKAPCPECGHSYSISITSCKNHDGPPAVKDWNVFDKKDQTFNATHMNLWYPPGFQKMAQDALTAIQEQVDAEFLKALRK